MAKWALDAEGLAIVERLRERPSVELVATLGAFGQVAALPYLAQMIPEENSRVTEATLRSIDRLLRQLGPSDLRRLDQEIRTRWFYSSWAPTITPKDVGKLVMRFDYPLAAAGICSMHRSGFIREEAVRRLAVVHTGEELPFLLIRAGDWVRQVRDTADRAIRDRLVAAYVPVFVDNLALLEGESFETGRASGLMPAIEQLFDSGEARSHLLRGLNHADRHVRRAASRRALHAGIDATTLLDTALSQDDVLVAQTVARAAIESASPNGRERLLDRLFGHPFGRVRQLALMARLEHFPGSSGGVLYETLFDRQAGVREIAQRALAKAGTDVAQRYRDALEHRPHIALLGLGESGTEADASLAVPFASSFERRVRKAAVRAISLLDPIGHREVLLHALEDPSPGVSRAATQGLERGGASAIAAELWRVLRSGEYEHHRRYAASLLTRADRWTMLEIGLRALLQPADELKVAGKQLVALSMEKWNRSATSPAPGKIAELLGLFERCRPWLAPREMDHVGFTLRSSTER